MGELESRESYKRINLTDNDAGKMRTREGFAISYNAQAMVSSIESGREVTGMLVTAVDVVDEPVDSRRLTPMMEHAEETTGTKVPMTLADAGYYSGSHLDECVRRGQQVAIPEPSRRPVGHPYHKDHFVYHREGDSYSCPGGQSLRFVGISRINGKPMRIYGASGAVCRACPAFGECTKDGRLGRNLAIGPHDAVLRNHRAWMETTEAKQVYNLRKQLVEPVFGIIKEQQGDRRFLLRGIVNVATEWTMLATDYNLRTLWRVWRSLARIHRWEA